MRNLAGTSWKAPCSTSYRMKVRPSSSWAFNSASLPPSKASGERRIERRARLDPAVAEQHFGETVPGKIVGAHLLAQFLAGEMIGHIRKADTRRNAGGTAQRREQRGLADTIAAACRQHARGPIDLRVGIIKVGVVA